MLKADHACIHCLCVYVRKVMVSRDMIHLYTLQVEADHVQIESHLPVVYVQLRFLERYAIKKACGGEEDRAGQK